MEQQEFSIGPYTRALWRRRWLIVIATVAALLAGVAATVLDSTESDPDTLFEAVAILRIEEPSPTSDSLAATTIQSIIGEQDSGIQTHIELIQGTNVLGKAVNLIHVASGEPTETDPIALDLAAQALDLDVSVSQVPRSELIAVSVVAVDAETARLRAESIVGAYQQFLREQQLLATQDAIDAIDERMEDFSQPAITSTRLKIFMERLSITELGRVKQAVDSSIARLDSLDLAQFDDVPSLQPVISNLKVAAAQFQTASIGLKDLENELAGTSDELAYGPGLQSIDTVKNLVATSLGNVRTVRADHLEIQLAADLNNALAEENSANTVLANVASQLASARLNTRIELEDRNLLSRLRDQILALRELNMAVSNSATLAVQSGTAGEGDRIQLLGQMNTVVSTLRITLNSITTVRQVQTETTAFTQLVNIEGQLQATINGLSTVASAISTSTSTGPGTTLSNIEDLLNDADERLDSIAISLGSGSSSEELLAAEISGTISTLTAAAQQTRSLRNNVQLRIVPSSATLLSVESQLNAGSSLLNDVSVNLEADASVTNQILKDRIRGARETAENSFSAIQLLQIQLAGIGVGRPTDAMLAALDKTALDLSPLIIESRSASQILVATASAGVSQTLSNRLSRFGSDLSNASAILDIAEDNIGNTAVTVRRMPEVLITSAYSELETIQSDVVATSELVNELRANADSGQALTPSDASEVVSRIQLVQVALGEVVSEISGVPSVELELVVQDLRSADSRIGTVLSQFSDIEAAETAAIDDLLEVRRVLELAVLSPQDTAVALVDTAINDRIGEDNSPLPLDTRILVGALGGLFLGLIGALVLEYTDRTVRRWDDIGHIAKLPNLGMVPQGLAKGNPHPPEITDDPASVFSEAVHLVTTRIQSRVTERSRVLLVASPGAREGKTMMAINLAKALSLRSMKVLLIDANFRKPDTSAILELEDAPGLATALTQDRSPEEFIQRLEEGRLDVLPAGRSLVPPVELISRPNMLAFLERVRQKYDFVIVDGPPAVGFAESNALAKQVGAVIMVARAGSTEKASLSEATENLSGTEIIGAVMNFVSPKELGDLEHRDYAGRTRTGKWYMPRLSAFRFSKN